MDFMLASVDQCQFMKPKNRIEVTFDFRQEYE